MKNLSMKSPSIKTSSIKTVSIKNMLANSLIILSLILFTACGGTKKALVTEDEIVNAQKSGELAALYDKVNKLASEGSGSQKKQASETLSRIANLLVAEKNQQAQALLEQHKADNTSVTRRQFQDLLVSIAPMQQWSAEDYNQLKPQVERGLQTVNQLIQQSVDRSAAAGDDKVAAVLALKQAAMLAGADQQENIDYQQALDQALESLQQQGNQALAKRQFSQAVKIAQQGLTLDADNIKFDSILSQGQAGSFESEFRNALENAKPELAYQALNRVADEPFFIQIKKNMQRSILVLADYFAGNAQKAYKAGYLSTAYQDFNRARNIQQKLSISPLGFAQERAFVDMIMSNARNTSFAPGKRMAFMRIAEEFDADYPGLKSEHLKLKQQIKKRALTKLSVKDFREISSSQSVVNSVGRRIGSKLEKMIFEKLANEVLVVTSIQTSQLQRYDGLALEIDGEILQAAIEKTANQGKRTQKVQTAVDRQETEEYSKWKKRKKGDAPKQYHETPIFEEVVLTVEHEQKQAIAEVAFRVIEPLSGKVLLTDNLVRQSEHKGESINEYQKGDFKQDYVKADLPSDIKIMDDLSSELAEGLGKKLVKYLTGPEDIFYQKYQQAKNQGNKIDATEYLANALIIAEYKQKDTEEWYRQFKFIVL